MGVRIYQLAKQLCLASEEVIGLLRARGLDVSGPSNTIPAIYADALVEELEGRTTKKDSDEAEKFDHAADVAVRDGGVSDTATGSGVVAASNVAPVSRSLKAREYIQHRDAVESHVGVGKLARDRKIESSKIRVEARKKEADAPSVSFNGIDIFPKKREEPKPVPEEPVPAAEPEEQRPVFKQFLKKIERPVKQTVLQSIVVKQPIIVRDLAVQMDVKPFQLISKLMSMNMFASMNQALDPVVAQQVAERFGFSLEIKHRGDEVKQRAAKQEKKPAAVVDRKRNLSARPPVVCVLGHVDHGKTTLLDTIRKTRVAQGEAGGITQHVAAYQVEHGGKKITFIDTPGHAAFSKMRERGANLTDIAVLVVAADDGFMPQTDEALNFIKRAGIPVVVAINKIDAKGANVDRVKQQMQQRAITSEDWGGEVLCAHVSALHGTNITDLLELILLQAEMLELQSDSDDQATGVILESQIEVGRGPTASAIIQDGTLRVGDCIVCGASYCKVRLIADDFDRSVKFAPPAAPVKIIGWINAPAVGETFSSAKNEKEARRAVEENTLAAAANERSMEDGESITDLDQLMSAISAEKDKFLRLVVRADVHGSAEALEECLLAIGSKKIKLEIIDVDVGSISKNDIELAATAGATVVGFNTKFESGVQALAKNQRVPIIQHNIIYEIVDQVRDAMANLLDPELHEQKLGAAEVRRIFSLKSETIAGCMVTEGKILRDQFTRVIRKKTVIFQGKFSSIKHLKEDLVEVRAGFECGIKVAGFDQFEVDDIIECFEIKKIQPAL